MPKTIRVAAAGDIHAGSADGDRVREAFRTVEEQADLVVLAGDLTQHGQVDEVCVVADACRGLGIPVVAVLGNHDWQSDRPGDLVRALAEAGVVVLDRSHTIVPVNGVSVGVAGVKGFVGGFGNQWANFGEPIFREAYAETTRDVDGPRPRPAGDRGVRGADRAAALLARRGHARRRAGAALARARRRPSRRPDPPAPSRPGRARTCAPRLVRRGDRRRRRLQRRGARDGTRVLDLRPRRGAACAVAAARGGGELSSRRPCRSSGAGASGRAR